MIICNSTVNRDQLISFLKANGIWSVFHYLPLHKSEYYLNKYEGSELPKSDYYSDCLIRLPMYYELESEQIETIIEKVKEFYTS